MHPDIILPLFGLPAHTGVMIYLIIGFAIFSFVVCRRLEMIPNKTSQGFVEVVIEGILNFAEDIMGHHGKKYFPFVATIALYILISNLIGLIPGLLPPTANLNTTAGLALVVFLATHIIGIREHGLKYLKRFMGPVWWLSPLMIPIELVGHMFRPFSLSFRLFGNMMGHELIVGIIMMLAPLLAPLPMQILGIMVSFVQAFVFSLLTMMYISGACEEAH